MVGSANREKQEEKSFLTRNATKTHIQTCRVSGLGWDSRKKEFWSSVALAQNFTRAFFFFFFQSFSLKKSTFFLKPCWGTLTVPPEDFPADSKLASLDLFLLHLNLLVTCLHILLSLWIYSLLTLKYYSVKKT